MSESTIWLHPNGTEGSKGWDAKFPRIATIGHFVHAKNQNASVMGLCTHFDHIGEESKKESAKLVQELVEAKTNGTSKPYWPFWVAGDFNSTPQQDAFKILNANASALQDTRELAKWHYGNFQTATGLPEGGPGVGRSTIDFVLVGPRGETDWKVQGNSVLGNYFDSQIYSSDHRAVVADLVLRV